MKPLDTGTRGPGDTGKDYFSPRHRVSASPRPVYNTVKVVAACLLLFSFFLPMSSCSYTVPLEMSVEETAPGSGGVTTETRTTIVYAREFVDPGEIGAWLNMLSFTWPFFLIILQWKFSGRRISLLLTWTGVLLSVLSAVVIYTWADIGEPLIGAYVGGGAVLLLFTIYVLELVQQIKGGRVKVRDS